MATLGESKFAINEKSNHQEDNTKSILQRSQNHAGTDDQAGHGGGVRESDRAGTLWQGGLHDSLCFQETFGMLADPWLWAVLIVCGYVSCASSLNVVVVSV